MLLDLGQGARARALLSEALVIAARLGEVWPVGQALLTLALADAVDEHFVDAARRIGAAQKIAKQSGFTMPVHYQRRIDQATALAERGLGHEAFATELDEGHKRPMLVVAAALEDTERSGSRAVPLINLSDLAGLTSRERGVLRLLTDGRTDREIGEALFISRNTASNHVANILSKLDVTSRSAAVAKAMQQHLT